MPVLEKPQEERQGLEAARDEIVGEAFLPNGQLYDLS